MQAQDNATVSFDPPVQVDGAPIVENLLNDIPDTLVVQMINDLESMAESPDIFPTESGVILRLRKVNAMLIKDAVDRLPPAPKPPVVLIEDKGRSEPNPLDPQYQYELRRYNEKLENISMHTCIAFGTDLLSKPDDFPGPDDSDWSAEVIENMEAIGMNIDIPSRGRGRYLAWVKYRVLSTAEFATLQMQVLRYSQVISEAKVKQAIDNFRNRTQRDSA